MAVWTVTDLVTKYFFFLVSGVHGVRADSRRDHGCVDGYGSRD